MNRHDCTAALTAPPATPCLRPCCAATYLGRARSTVLRLVECEGLPAINLAGGDSRRLLAFRRADLEDWIAGRRSRQVMRTVSGDRYTRAARR